MSKSAIVLIFTAAMTWHTSSASAELVIEAEKAAIRTEGGPNAGGGWNLWSNGRVGQPLRFQNAGTYGIVVRAWGSRGRRRLAGDGTPGRWQGRQDGHRGPSRT